MTVLLGAEEESERSTLNGGVDAGSQKTGRGRERQAVENESVVLGLGTFWIGPPLIIRPLLE